MIEYLDYSDRLKKDHITFHVSKDCDVVEHSHTFLELAYVSHGTVEHVLNGTKKMLQKGDYLIVDFHAKHSYRQIGKEPICVINCLFLPDFIDRILVNSRSFHQLIQHYLIRMGDPLTVLRPNALVFQDDGRIAQLIEHMQAEYEKKQAGYLEIIRSNLIEIMIQTMRKLSISSSREGRVCDTIICYVNENYTKNISLTHLSKEMNYSLPYLSRKFKEETGMTFCSYVQKVRIDQSCRLLANTQKNVLEIAQLVGYSDVKFFNRIFKTQRNMSPRTFRSLVRKGTM